MSPETLFALSFPLAAPFWLLMIATPWWSVTRRIIASPLIVVPPLLVYLLALWPQFGTVFSSVSAPSSAGIAALLGTPTGAAIAWAHFIGFDLFVGRWIFLDSRSRGISGLLLAPVLLLTILLAPLGLLAYLALRTALPTRTSPGSTVLSPVGHADPLAPG